MRRAAKSAASLAWARSVLATTISPLVSLSSRCTMPGRRTPPIPARLSPQWARRAFTSVRSGLPGAGCTTSPAGFSQHQEVGVLVADVERHRLRGGQRRRSPRAAATATTLARFDPLRRVGYRRAVHRYPARPRRAASGGCARDRRSGAPASGPGARRPRRPPRSRSAAARLSSSRLRAPGGGMSCGPRVNPKHARSQGPGRGDGRPAGRGGRGRHHHHHDTSDPASVGHRSSGGGDGRPAPFGTTAADLPAGARVIEMQSAGRRLALRLRRARRQRGDPHRRPRHRDGARDDQS